MKKRPQYELQGKRVLVTGGSGFIGSHLCEQLLACGHDVLCVDNFFTGTRRNVERLRENPRFELVRHDVTFPLFVEVMKSTTSPVPLHRFTISSIRYRRPRPA